MASFMHGQLAQPNSLYLIDLYRVIPAYGGLERSLSVNFNNRQQWSAVTGNPRQVYLNAHLPVKILKGGAGLYAYNDNIGLIRQTGAGISFNRLIYNELGVFSYGLKLGLKQARLDGTRITTPDGIYTGSLFSHEDLILPLQGTSGFGVEYGLSLFIGHELFDIGVSFENYANGVQNLGFTGIDNSQQFTIFGRLPFRFLEMTWHPSLLIRSNFQVVQTDLSCLVKSGNVFGGLSLRGFDSRSLDSVVVIAGIQFNSNYKISYSYDIGLSEIGLVSDGSHEILIHYNLNKLLGIGMPPEIIHNPRFL